MPAPTGRAPPSRLSDRAHATPLHTPSCLLLLPLHFQVPWELSPSSAAAAPPATCPSTRASFFDSSSQQLRLVKLHHLRPRAAAVVEVRGCCGRFSSPHRRGRARRSSCPRGQPGSTFLSSSFRAHRARLALAHLVRAPVPCGGREVPAREHAVPPCRPERRRGVTPSPRPSWAKWPWAEAPARPPHSPSLGLSRPSMAVGQLVPTGRASSNRRFSFLVFFII